MKKLIIGNWKMNPASFREAKELFQLIKKGSGGLKRAQAVVCAPHIYLRELKSLTGVSVSLGAQNVHWENSGAFTGEVSPKMLVDAGVKYVIVGHSERRSAGETNDIVNLKLKAALKAGLFVVLCVGETERDEHGNYLSVVNTQLEEVLAGVPKSQLKNIAIAYEPVWAIGSQATRADTPEEFRHNAIFVKKVVATLKGQDVGEAIPVLYGGSVNTKNCEGFLKEGEADGLLVGRGSLKAKNFIQILKVANTL